MSASLIDAPSFLTGLCALLSVVINMIFGLTALARETQSKRQKQGGTKQIMTLLILACLIGAVGIASSVWAQARANEYQAELEKYIRGGEDFVVLDIGRWDNKPDELIFYLSNFSESPVFDVRVQINDEEANARYFSSLTKTGKLNLDEYELQRATVKTILLGTVPAKIARMRLATYGLAGFETRGFFVDTWVRNGYCRDWFKGVKVGGTWVFARRRDIQINGKQLEPIEHVPIGFPRGRDGLVGVR